MTKNSNEIQIRTLVENWARAVRDGNMDGMLANHAKNVLIFNVPLQMQSKGIEANKKTWDLI